MTISLTILLISILQLTKSQITYVRSHTVKQGSTPRNILSFHCEINSNIALLFTDNSKSFVNAGQILPSVTPTNYDITSSTSNISGMSGFLMQIRTASGNTNTNSGKYLIFSTSKAVYYNSGLGSASSVLTVSTPLIINECFFQTNSNTLFFILISGISANYTLRSYNKTNQLNSVILPVQSTNKLVRIASSKSFIYMMFQNCVVISEQNQNMVVRNLIHILSTAGVYSFDVFKDLLVYSLDQQVSILNVTDPANPINFQEFNLTTQINDLRIREPYLYIITGSTIRQYDLDTKKTISILSNVNTTQYRMEMLKQQIIYLYQPFPNLHTALPVYKVSNIYLATTCDEGYVSTAGKCIKNLTYQYPEPIPNTTVPSPGTDDPIPTNSTQDTDNQTHHQPIDSPPSEESTSELADPIKNISIEEQEESEIWQVIGKILTFSSTKLIPLMSQFSGLLLDDIWYYKFHRVNYPRAVHYFTQKIDIINYFRLNPWFLENINVLDKISIGEQGKSVYGQLISQHKNNPESIYFMNNSKQIYVDNWIMNFLFFAAIKFLHMFFFYLKEYFPKATRIYRHIRNNSRWWSLITSSLQSSIMRLTFNCALQFVYFFYFNPNTKFNLFFCMFIFFIITFYTTQFYVTIFIFSKKKSAEILLAHSTYFFSSFLFESFCFLFRSWIRGFIQGILIESYHYQIIALTASDAFFFTFTLLFRHHFYCKLLFIVMIIYNFLFFVLDLTLALSQSKPDLFISFNTNQFLYVLIWGILAVFLLQIIVSLVFAIIETIKRAKRVEAEIDQQEEHQKRVECQKQKIEEMKAKSFRFQIKQKGICTLKNVTDSSHRRFSSRDGRRKQVKIQSKKDQTKVDQSFVPVERLISSSAITNVFFKERRPLKFKKSSL